MNRVKFLRTLRESFIARIAVVIVAIVVVLSGFFDYFLIRMQAKSYEKDTLSHGQALVRLLAQSVSVAVFTENEGDFFLPVDAIMNHADVIRADIFNKKGERLYMRQKQQSDPAQRLENPAELAAVFKQIEQSGELYRQTGESFIFWHPVIFKSAAASETELYFEGNGQAVRTELTGYAALAVSKKSFSQGVRQIMFNTGLLALLYLAAGIMAILAIVRRMSRPLAHVLEKIRESSADLNGHDDLSLLSETHAGMIRELENSFRTITELKDGLEFKVRQRTAELSVRQRQLEEVNSRLLDTLAELRKTQQQLIQKEKMAAMGRMVAGVAHEINNSVNFISGALPSVRRLTADLGRLAAGFDALEKADTSEEMDERLAVVRDLKEEIDYGHLFTTFELLLANMEEGAQRATRIIKDMKIFSRQDDEDFKEVDLHAVIDSTIPFMDSRGGKVEISKDYGEIGPVRCIPGRISQVFQNILDNAAQAMGNGGTLTITTRQRRDRVYLRFADTGRGIAEDILPRIFDPFFTTKEVGEGSGLGLGISYDIVRQHGGEIEVESTVGRGTSFEVILPVSPTGGAGEEYPDAQQTDVALPGWIPARSMPE
ncbi:MAG: hypothetical protein HY885_14500 [Deltaproteobacteria bacterium]|nr:hypothetical protein [Deltaproteobacteria bacterium]